MSSMTTLEKVYERVSGMARFHEDRMIPVDDVFFNDLETVCISGATYNMRSIAQQSICYRLGIPIHYLRKCPADIQQNNLNYWIKHEKNDKLFFRFDGDEIRAIFTPRYVPTDNLEVLDRLLEHGYKPNTRVQCSLDDEFMLVSVPDDRETFRINGDRMTPGISVSNSEVGLAALSISHVHPAIDLHQWDDLQDRGVSILQACLRQAPFKPPRSLERTEVGNWAAEGAVPESRWRARWTIPRRP